MLGPLRAWIPARRYYWSENKISGVIGNDRPSDVYLNPEGTSYLASPGGIERVGQ